MMDDWAMKWARDLTGIMKLVSERDAYYFFCKMNEAFAAYIREHAQPPVDPDLIEARKLEQLWRDDGSTVGNIVLLAVKRGRELEREGR